MNGNNKGRKNWTLSMTIVVVIAAAAAVIGCIGGPHTSNADRVYLNSSAGAVLFDHGAHQDNIDACATCHHDLYTGKLATTCTDCHDESMKAEDFKHAELKDFHQRDCSRCHEASEPQTQPSSCRDCHAKKQESEVRTETCQQCHDDSFEPGMMAHNDYLQVEDHSCLGCHNPVTVSEAYHTNCTGCHRTIAPEKFVDEKDAPVCRACHLR